jgi:hypothetical protein
MSTRRLVLALATLLVACGSDGTLAPGALGWEIRELTATANATNLTVTYRTYDRARLGYGRAETAVYFETGFGMAEEFVTSGDDGRASYVLPTVNNMPVWIPGGTLTACELVTSTCAETVIR